MFENRYTVIYLRDKHETMRSMRPSVQVPVLLKSVQVDLAQSQSTTDHAERHRALRRLRRTGEAVGIPGPSQDQKRYADLLRSNLRRNRSHGRKSSRVEGRENRRRQWIRSRLQTRSSRRAPRICPRAPPCDGKDDRPLASRLRRLASSALCSALLGYNLRFDGRLSHVLSFLW